MSAELCGKLKVDGACLRAGSVIDMLRETWVSLFIRREQLPYLVARDGKNVQALSHFDFALCRRCSLCEPHIVARHCASDLQIRYLLKVVCLAMSSSTADSSADFFPNLLEARERGKRREVAQATQSRKERSSPLRGLQAEKEPLEGVVDVLVALRCFLPLH